MDESSRITVAFGRNAAENKPKRWRQRNKEPDKKERMYGADVRGALSSLQRQRDNESASYVFI